MAREKLLFLMQLIQLYNAPAFEEFSFETLCKIHKIIFGDIYEWAGQTRRGDFLAKGIRYFAGKGGIINGEY
jgi:fido (protein-threonine AMPylation protein)